MCVSHIPVCPQFLKKPRVILSHSLTVAVALLYGKHWGVNPSARTWSAKAALQAVCWNQSTLAIIGNKGSYFKSPNGVPLNSSGCVQNLCSTLK